MLLCQYTVYQYSPFSGRATFLQQLLAFIMPWFCQNWSLKGPAGEQSWRFLFILRSCRVQGVEQLYVSFQRHRMEPMTWHLPHAEPLREWLLFESIEAHPSESAVEAFSEGISCHTPREFTARNDNSENCPGLMCPAFPSYASKKSPKSADPKLRKHMETTLPATRNGSDSESYSRSLICSCNVLGGSHELPLGHPK